MDYGITYSLDKARRWELLDALKADEEGQLALDASPATDEPRHWRTAVVEGNWTYTYRTKLYSFLDPDRKLANQHCRNAPLAPRPTHVWSQNRKGQVRKPLRTPGKKVVHPTHHNSHKARADEIAAADEVFHVHHAISPQSVEKANLRCYCHYCCSRDRRSSRPNRNAAQLHDALN